MSNGMGFNFPVAQLPPIFAVLILVGTVVLIAHRSWKLGEKALRLSAERS